MPQVNLKLNITIAENAQSSAIAAALIDALRFTIESIEEFDLEDLGWSTVLDAEGETIGEFHIAINDEDDSDA